MVLQCRQEAAESGRVEAGRDAQASAVAEDEFEGRRGGRRVVADFKGHKGERLAGDGSRGRPFAQESPPGVEGGFGQTVAAAKGRTDKPLRRQSSRSCRQCCSLRGSGGLPCGMSRTSRTG